MHSQFSICSHRAKLSSSPVSKKFFDGKIEKKEPEINICSDVFEVKWLKNQHQEKLCQNKKNYKAHVIVFLVKSGKKISKV